ncbi:MAG TPA: glucosaminidase domain-containing protein [Flavitalea sp.]|nr:glucosaminidase domain-containing protein [Flavitalea sp.]
MKITSLFSICLLISFFSLAQPKSDIYEYIRSYKEIAMSEMKRSGVPASIKLAQGIHETYAGKSDLVLKSKNHFGIKCKSEWTGNKVYHDDDARGECFRSYASPADSYVDHSNFLRNSARYAFLFNFDPTDYKAWAYGLKKAGYATNVKYSEIIIRLIEEYNLNQYSLIALNRMDASQEDIAGGQLGVLPTTVPAGEVIAIDGKVTEVIKPVKYPDGEFYINNTRVVFARQGSSLLSIAQTFDVSLSRILDFNDLKGEDILLRDQLVFLQRKRKAGVNEFHIVQQGESLYDIAQAEGIRLHSLLELNHLQTLLDPAAGEKLFLQKDAPSRPKLAIEVSTSSTRESVPEDPVRNERVLHTVRLKETLYSISKKYAVDIDSIRSWNNLPGFGLKPGQELVIYKN